jgi:hypothetical protein
MRLLMSEMRYGMKLMPVVMSEIPMPDAAG